MFVLIRFNQLYVCNFLQSSLFVRGIWLNHVTSIESLAAFECMKLIMFSKLCHEI